MKFQYESAMGTIQTLVNVPAKSGLAHSVVILSLNRHHKWIL